MATRKTVKKPAATVKRTVKVAAKPVRKATTKAAKSAKAIANASVAHKVVLAGLGAAERAQGEAMKVYTAIAREAERLTEMTTEAAQTLARKAGVLARDGKKIQAEVQAVAQSKAAAVAKEVKAFAAKSEKTLKKNFQGLNSTTAQAREGITRLEQVFESRVAKTLNTFGVPSAQNVRELQTRMADLQKALNELNRRTARA